MDFEIIGSLLFIITIFIIAIAFGVHLIRKEKNYFIGISYLILVLSIAIITIGAIQEIFITRQIFYEIEEIYNRIKESYIKEIE